MGENNSDFTKFEMLNPDSEVVHQYLEGMGYTTEEIGDWRKFQSRPEVSAFFKTHPTTQYSTMIEHLLKNGVSVCLNLRHLGEYVLHLDGVYYTPIQHIILMIVFK